MIEMSVSRLEGWTAAVDALARNVEAKYRELRKDGCIGMSRRNLRQVVSTRGVMVSRDKFDRCLEHAIERANVPAGFFYGELA